MAVSRPQCALCGSTEGVERHHVSYDPEETIPACSECHRRIHHEEGYHDELVPEENRGEEFESALENYRIEARLSPGLAAAVEDYRTERGVSKSEVVREAIEHYLGDQDDTAGGPTDPDLRETWATLREHSDDRGIVRSEDVLPTLAAELNLKKRAVIRSRIEPLDRTGWLTARGGRFVVHDRPRDEGPSGGSEDGGLSEQLVARPDPEGVEAKLARLDRQYGSPAEE